MSTASQQAHGGQTNSSSALQSLYLVVFFIQCVPAPEYLFLPGSRGPAYLTL